MREPKRVIRSTAALDDVSDHMGEILRRADELLADWSRFGAEVRTQVDREAQHVGHAVASAVDGAVGRVAVTSVERVIADQIGTKLTALSTEIGKLEARARAASRAIAEDRRGDRRVLWAVGAGVVIANGLLVAMLLRGPSQTVLPAPEPTRIEVPVVAPIDAAVAPPPAEPAPEPAPAGSAQPPPASEGSAKPPAAPAKVEKAGTRPTPVPARPTVKVGAPHGTKPLAVPPTRKK
jgi:hypothetical protein